MCIMLCYKQPERVELVWAGVSGGHLYMSWSWSLATVCPHLSSGCQAVEQPSSHHTLLTTLHHIHIDINTQTSTQYFGELLFNVSIYIGICNLTKLSVFRNIVSNVCHFKLLFFKQTKFQIQLLLLFYIYLIQCWQKIDIFASESIDPGHHFLWRGVQDLCHILSRDSSCYKFTCPLCLCSLCSLYLVTPSFLFN